MANGAFFSGSEILPNVQQMQDNRDRRLDSLFCNVGSADGMLVHYKIKNHSSSLTPMSKLEYSKTLTFFANLHHNRSDRRGLRLAHKTKLLEIEASHCRALAFVQTAKWLTNPLSKKH
jgi:hypothetical protein